LNRLSIAGKVIGFDADARAIEECSQRFRGEIGKRLTLVNRNFSELGEWLADQQIGEINGILLDLGVSSFQFDAEVGFSYRSDSPLDMRFQRDRGTSARDIVNEYSAEELVRIFREYGEEQMSKAIANAIVKRRNSAKIETTFQLRDAVASVVPERFLVKRLSRIFQALRIAVNDELGALEKVLSEGVGAVKQGGRIVVISYHSLEDRIVKNFFRYEALSCVCPPHTPVCTCGKIARMKIITRKAIIPGENETRMNTRARSAKLRAAQKIV
jgi:16S rRNA (cytosine1402-N4)-methyltransferase